MAAVKAVVDFFVKIEKKFTAEFSPQKIENQSIKYLKKPFLPLVLTFFCKRKNQLAPFWRNTNQNAPI